MIKSLSTGEKALVRKSDEGQKGYIALFDTIARQRQFDERKIKKRLKSLGIDINYAYAKNYLTKHILKTLREHRDGPGTGIRRQVSEVEILMERKVHSLAEKILSKARTRAKSEERWHDFLQLSQYEMKLLLQEGGKVDDSLQRITALNAERKQARAQLSNLGEYQDLYYTYRPVLMRKQRARNEWDLGLIAQFREDALVQDEGHALSARARRIYLMCRPSMHVFSGDIEQAENAISTLIAHYRAHSFLIDDHPIDFINTLLQLGSIQLHYQAYPKVEALLHDIQTLQKDRAIHESEIFDKYYRLLTGLALQTRNFDLIETHLEEIGQGLTLYRDSLPWSSICTLLFMLGRLHFDHGDFEAARGWLNQVLDQPNRGIREDIVSLSRILLIFIYLETGEFELVESSSRATRKYLRRREQLHRFEARILKYLETNSFHGTSREEIDALKSLRSDLEGIFEDRLERNVLDFFDILSWLEGKIAKLEG
ncbi:MAG: hypothetical protein AAF570_10845 [Bacteroidota bacterium]